MELKTSDPQRKKCVVDKENNGCIEVEKEGNNIIKMPLTLLILILFLLL